jgi:CBS domain-containing protein
MSDPPRSDLTASDVMTACPRTCSPFSSVLEAVMIFRDVDCGAVPVVDGGVAVGVLTDRDVARASADGNASLTRLVTDIMGQGATSVTPDTPLEEVREKFVADPAPYLLVVDGAGQLQGIITASDLAPTPTSTEGTVCAK